MKRDSERPMLQDKYTADEFEDKIFPYCVGGAIVLVLMYIVACIINPWNILLVPLVGCGLIFVILCVGLLACCGAEKIRQIIEFVTERDFN